MNEIIKSMRSTGYIPQVFLLNASLMDVPQARERIFIIAHRSDLNLPKLYLAYNGDQIPFGRIRSEHGKPSEGMYASLLNHRIHTDKTISDIQYRVLGRARAGFNHTIISDDRVAGTLPSSGSHYRMFDGMCFSDIDYIETATFPIDYDFCGRNVQFVTGMSVPPRMMEHIANDIHKQWLS